MKSKLTLLSLLLSTIISAQFVVDFNSNNGTFKTFGSVNSGFLNTVDAAYSELGIKDVRTHAYTETDFWRNTTGFVTLPTTPTGNAVFNTDFNPQLAANYCFETGADPTIKSLVNSGYTPYFRLGVSWPKLDANATPPYIPRNPPLDANGNTFHIFSSICSKTVSHYTAGKTNKDFSYNIPYWEVWNEPDGVFWTGTPQQFYQLYREVSDSIKAINPNLKVGTCGLTKNSITQHKKEYFDNLLSYCKDNKLKLDFFSWHLYGRFNPYSIKNYADTVHTVLAKYGYGSAESHISEINAELTQSSVYDTSVKGAAYVASLLMTCQESYVDKIFWFTGDGLGSLANPDPSTGVSNLTWKGYGMKSHNVLVEETPIKLTSSGNEVLNFFQTKDTTNLMIMAGKDLSGTKLDILISNLNSNHNTLSVDIKNLPYASSDNVKIEQYTCKGVDTKYATTSYIVAGSSTLKLDISSATSPSVFLFKISKLNATNLHPATDASQIIISPNPAKDKLIFYKSLQNIEVYNLNGELVIPNIKSARQISIKELNDGIYILRSENFSSKFIVKN